MHLFLDVAPTPAPSSPGKAVTPSQWSFTVVTITLVIFILIMTLDRLFAKRAPRFRKQYLLAILIIALIGFFGTAIHLFVR